MAAKINLTILLLLCSSFTYCQTDKIEVFIDKLNMQWQSVKPNDTLNFNKWIIAADTFDIEVISTGTYGSYNLTMTNINTNEKQHFCYSGDKTKFEFVISVRTRKKIKVYLPTITNCYQ